MNNIPSRLASDCQAYSAIQKMADCADRVVWMTDADGVCLYLNQETAAFFENASDFAVDDWAQVVHPEDLERIRPIYREAKAVHGEYRFEYRVLCSNGTERWMLGIGAPRFSLDREFQGYVGTILDVTAHHDALNKLEKSEAQLRLVTENSGDLITHHDSEGRLLYISPSCKSVIGYEAEELLGDSAYALIHPEDAAALQSQITHQLDAPANSDEVLELRIRHKAGHYVWMGSRTSVLSDPVTKQKIGTVAVGRDITAAKLAKTELQNREERFRSLTHLSSDWYWETDAEDRFIFRSDSGGVPQRYPKDPNTIIGKRRIDYVLKRDDPQFCLYLEKVAKREPFRDIQYECDWGDGIPRFVHISGEPVFEQGVFKGYRGVGRDITNERRAAAKLAHLASENRALIENTLDIMAMLDQEGRFVRVNSAALDILGYTPEELLGRQYGEFIHPDDSAAAAAVDVSLRTGVQNTVRDFETRWLRKDGGIVHLSLGVRWADDQRAMFATARDVTERNRIRAELQKSKDELSTVLESIGDAFFSLDRDWRATYVNRKTAMFIGREADDLVGKVLWEALPEIRGTEVFRHYQRAMVTGQNTFFEAYWEATGAWVEVRAYPHEDGLSVFFHDVTSRRAAEEAVRASERRLREIIEMTPAGYLIADAEGEILDVNPALCQMTGFEESAIVGTPVSSLFQHSPCCKVLQPGARELTIQARDAVLKHRDGQEVHVLVNASVQRDKHGKPEVLTAFVTDITERKQAAARLEHLATHDTLTGLPNRAWLNDHLQHLVETASAEQGLAVLFIDLDRFKAVNDTLGHEKGDALLTMAANRLQRILRPGDVVARLGGDEFVVAVQCSAAAAERIAQKLLSVLVSPFSIAGQEVYVGASIGISLFPQDGETKELLFQNADTAMYEAKASGRNGYRFFKAEMSIEAKHRVMLENALRRALERKEFELHYQPRIDLSTGTVEGVEALIRWNHPQLGRVPPLQFIPIAEEAGFIEEIGKWVLDQACVHTRQLMDQLGRPLRVSVNLSARQLKRADLRDQVADALAKSRLPADFLELELTESALIEDLDMSANVLKSLKALGISLSVDDFGTGYSGLAYLRKFPIDILKLDRSFVTQEDEGISNSRFIKAFVDLAHALNLSVVAEGVETEDILQMLRGAECDEAQGYFFSRPLPFNDLVAYLKKAKDGA